jgi:beta-1,4-N-acetylglucosaminyltransferase
MRRCKAPPQGTGGGKSDGVVICHAGAGTILDCLRLDIPTIVVPNTSLLDNHQDELARELERQGYVTRGSVESVDELVEALGRSEKKNLTRERTRWGGGGGKAEGRRGVVGVMDEEVGYEMRMREVLD